MILNQPLRVFLDLCRPEGISLEAVLKRSEECGIGGLMRAYLGVESPEKEVRQECRIVAWLESYRRVREALGDLRTIVLKGVPLSIYLHGCDNARETSDIDLWLAREDFGEAEARLGSVGYVRQEVKREWATNQMLFLHETLVPVELHWALTQPPLRAPSFEDAWRRRVTERYGDVVSDGGLSNRFGDVAWARPGESDTRLHLLFHALQHIGAVKPWADLAAASDLEAGHDTLHEYGVSRLDRLIRETISPKGRIPHIEVMASKALRLYFRGILGTGRGEFIPGKDSKVGAAQAVLARAASTICLDGVLYPAQALAFHAKLVAAVVADKF